MRRRRLPMSSTDPRRPQRDFRAASDRIPSTRPPWWHRQYRDIKKLIFLTPSTCPIDVFGPVANRRILKQMHGVHIKSNKTGPPQLLHFAFQVLFDPYFCNIRIHRVPAAVTHHSVHAGDVCQHTCTPSTLQPHSSLCTLGPHTSRSQVSAHTALAA